MWSQANLFPSLALFFTSVRKWLQLVLGFLQLCFPVDSTQQQAGMTLWWRKAKKGVGHWVEDLTVVLLNLVIHILWVSQLRLRGWAFSGTHSERPNKDWNLGFCRQSSACLPGCLAVAVMWGHLVRVHPLVSPEHPGHLPGVGIPPALLFSPHGDVGVIFPTLQIRKHGLREVRSVV